MFIRRWHWLFTFIMIPGSIAGAFEILPAKAPAPPHNPTTREKVELGKILYFDPRLSRTGTVSCNSCHNVMLGGEDNRPVSVGINGLKGGRSSPTVWNSAILSAQFWDGRARDLEEQAQGPIANPVEMGATHELVVDRLRSIEEYRRLFARAFGAREPITIDRVAQAIASYERTLITPDAPADLYLKGQKKALSEQQIRGMKTFESVGCVACHSGVNYAGPALPVGQGFYMKFPTFPGTVYETKYDLLADPGRFSVTKKEEDRNFWRVPTLHNVALTAPYFHNGRVETLAEAVRVMAKTQLNRELTPAQVEDLVAFLESLTGKFPAQTMPRLPATPRTSFTQTADENKPSADQER